VLRQHLLHIVRAALPSICFNPHQEGVEGRALLPLASRSNYCSGAHKCKRTSNYCSYCIQVQNQQNNTTGYSVQNNTIAITAGLVVHVPHTKHKPPGSGAYRRRPHTPRRRPCHKKTCSQHHARSHSAGVTNHSVTFTWPNTNLGAPWRFPFPVPISTGAHNTSINPTTHSKCDPPSTSHHPHPCALKTAPTNKEGGSGLPTQ
jgi:hypothetical protein